jgi:hypothetical protein
MKPSKMKPSNIKNDKKIFFLSKSQIHKKNIYFLTMSLSSIEIISATMNALEGGSEIDSTTEKFLKKMAKYAVKIKEHLRKSNDESDDGESKSKDESDEEIIYADSDDDTHICAITDSNIVDGKRVRKPVQKYQDPDYDKIILKDVPKNEIDAALVDSDIDEDESDSDDELLLDRNREQFYAENEENESNLSNLRVPDQDSDFEPDDGDEEDDSDVEWLGVSGGQEF